MISFKILDKNCTFYFDESTSLVAVNILKERYIEFQKTGACYLCYIDNRLIPNNHYFHYLLFQKDKFYGKLGASVYEILINDNTQQSNNCVLIQNPDKLSIGIAV